MRRTEAAYTGGGLDALGNNGDLHPFSSSAEERANEKSADEPSSDSSRHGREEKEIGLPVVGAPSADFDLSRLPEQLHHLVNRLPSEEEVFADVCEHRQRKGLSRFLMHNVMLSLRSYGEDMTGKCPSLLSEFSFAIFNNPLLPIGVEFRA